MRGPKRSEKLRAMDLNGITVAALLIGVLALFDLAALRWGVDSRRLGVRSDVDNR